MSGVCNKLCYKHFLFAISIGNAHFPVDITAFNFAFSNIQQSIYYTKDIFVVLCNPLNAESLKEILSCCTISLTASKVSFFLFQIKKSVKMKLRNNQFRYQFQNAKSTLGKDQTNCGSK